MIKKLTYKQIENKLSWRNSIIFGFVISSLFVVYSWMDYDKQIDKLQEENAELKLNNTNIKANLGYYEGKLKQIGEYVNVTCKIPKEVIEKNSRRLNIKIYKKIVVLSEEYADDSEIKKILIDKGHDPLDINYAIETFNKRKPS